MLWVGEFWAVDDAEPVEAEAARGPYVRKRDRSEVGILIENVCIGSALVGFICRWSLSPLSQRVSYRGGGQQEERA